jgi:hypothetical protein
VVFLPYACFRYAGDAWILSEPEASIGSALPDACWFAVLFGVGMAWMTGGLHRSGGIPLWRDFEPGGEVDPEA